MDFGRELHTDVEITLLFRDGVDAKILRFMTTNSNLMKKKTLSDP